jgi:LPPG:FO 2-phospho-L-lactate transferase
MAHRLLPAIGVEVDAAAVGLHYGARLSGGVLDAWAMDTADTASIERVEQGGLRAVVTDLIMRDPQSTAAFVRYAIKSATS